MSLQNLEKRYSGNPILTAEDLPGADGVFNCGAIKLYYAASDTCICLATFNLNAMVDACLTFTV